MAHLDMKSFHNALASDWVDSLLYYDDLSRIVDTIDIVFEEDYLDADIACEAIAAIEALALLKRRDGKSTPYSETIKKWAKSVKLSVPAEVVHMADQALNKIVSQESELYKLWEETESFKQWLGEIQNLKNRINLK